MAKVVASETLGWLSNTSSISLGDIFSPPAVFMSSFMRPVIFNRLSISIAESYDLDKDNDIPEIWSA